MGRHATPSQVEKVAGTAAKAAPAVAIAGALVALPQSAHAEVKTPASATAVTEQAHTTALVKQAARTYTVRSGDTLSAIAARFYHNPARWTWIYAANRSKIHNPNSIFVGEKLTIPSHAPTGTAAYTPRHAKKPQNTVLTSSAKKLSGNLGCSGLEALWKAAGGAPGSAFIAAEIAMAESGGRQYAHSPTNDFGYWQINGVHGAMATYNPIGNAKAAIAISGNGSHWGPWTTYVTGAYRGRC
jgi:LysM repeat protein